MKSENQNKRRTKSISNKLMVGQAFSGTSKIILSGKPSMLSTVSSSNLWIGYTNLDRKYSDMIK